MLASTRALSFARKPVSEQRVVRAPKCAVPTFIKSAQFRQELETARCQQCLVYSQEPHFHVRDSSSIKIVGNLWTPSARGWGWAVESESSQRSGGGGSAREQGAGGVRETGEDGGGSGREIQAFVFCFCLSSSQSNESNNVS